MGSAQLNSKQIYSQKGQGIIEVIVTIGIGTIMVMALVVLSIRANKSSDFSKASSQASNLASQGIEIINNLKNIGGVDTATSTNLFILNGPSCTGDSTSLTNWDGIFSSSNHIDDTTCPADHPGRIGYIIPSCYSGISCVYFKDSLSGAVTVDNQTYTRTVYLADTPKDHPLGAALCDDSPNSCGRSNCNFSLTDYSSVKQFTVDVSWNDSSGTHHQTNTACIGRY